MTVKIIRDSFLANNILSGETPQIITNVKWIEMLPSQVMLYLEGEFPITIAFGSGSITAKVEVVE